MRWLVVSPYLPHSRIGHGGGTCVYDLCRYLARDHEVRLLCFQRAGEAGLQAELEEAGVRVHTVFFGSEKDRGFAKLGLLVDRARCMAVSRSSQTPYMAVKYRREAMQRALEECLADFPADVVQVEYGFMGFYAKTAREWVEAHSKPGAEGAEAEGPARPAVLLNTHELVSLARLRRLSADDSWLQSISLRREVEASARYESGLFRWADEVLCVTDQDRVLLHALCGAENLRTIPLGSDVDALPIAREADDGPPTLLFVGSFTHPPNVDAAFYLIREILPRVWRRQPEVRAVLVGPSAPSGLLEAARAHEGRVQLPGFVPSLDESFDRARLFVAPLREGGGIKIKILEAMARGMPVVTTPIGVEGIDEEGRACRVASSAHALADSIVELLEETSARRSLAAAARRHIEESFGWPSIVERLERCAREVASRRIRP